MYQSFCYDKEVNLLLESILNTNPYAKTILCYGDSNTWGQKADKSRYPANVRWTGQLQEKLGGDYYIIEEGLSSRTTDMNYVRKSGRNGKTYLAPCLDSHRPLDMVILMLGTNDLKIEFNRSASEIAQAIEGLAGIIKEKAPNAKILLVSPIFVDDTKALFKELYPNYYNHESVIKSQQLVAEIEKLANAANCLFADASKVASAGDDGIHFSEAAHEALAALLYGVVKRAFSEESI